MMLAFTKSVLFEGIFYGVSNIKQCNGERICERCRAPSHDVQRKTELDNFLGNAF
jgi:hypothetical protein